jgi:hypothetical protein
MDFVYPTALWLLLPVAAWLLLGRNQTARPRHVVGNLYLWSQPAAAAPAQVTAQRTRRHWLVVLQAAIMTAIVVGLARPTVSWPASRVALIFDVSASMGASDEEGARIELARQAARSVIERLSRGTRVRLLAAGRETTDLGEFPADGPELRGALERVAAGAGTADLERAIRAARALGLQPGEVHIFSDTGDPRPISEGERWVSIGRPAANRAITSLTARRLPESPGTAQVIATIRNYSSSGSEVDLEILQAQRTVSRRTLRLEPQGYETVAVDVAVEEGSIHARLSGSDGLATDDQRFAVVPALRPARVLLIGRASFFLERALAVNPAVTLTTAPTGSSGPHSGIDVVVCEGCDSVPPSGDGVLLIPAHSFEDPATLTVSQPRHAIAAAMPAGGASVLSGEAGGLPEGADIVLRAGGRPALITYERDGRRVAELRVDVQRGGFPLSSSFPVLLEHTIAWLDRREDRAPGLPAGEPLHWRLRSDARPSDLSIVGPDGSELRSQVNGGVLTTTDTLAVGEYRVRGDGPDLPFTVNAVTEAESDLTRMAPRSAQPAASSVAGTTARVDPAPFLLLLAVALLGFEWRARSGGRRPS